MQQLAEHDLILSVNDLTRGYPATPSLLFHNLNLAIYKKDFLIIHGKSGVGKSTLIKLLMRTLRPPKKKVYYKHEDIAKFSDEEVQSLRRKLGIVFQDYKLIEKNSVENNILTSPMITHTSKEEAHKKVTELMLSLGLRHHADTPVKLLSGGEKQKVSIARALAHDPECLIADEATGNLDREQSKMIADIFISLNKKGHTVIFITHDIHLINYITDQHTVKLFEMK